MSSNINVRRHEPVLVIPAKQTKREIKQVSDIDDQQGLRFQGHLIMSYKGNQSKNLDPAKVIKEALSKALVYYYPMAGRLREGPNRKLMVDCNGEGVLFVEADAEVTLEEIQPQILPPCPLLEHLLFHLPGSNNGITHCPLLLFQVTHLLCGGYILGIRVNHCICDAPGLAQLLQAIAEIATGASKPSTMPRWERELLIARYPPRVTCTHHEYEEVSNKHNQQRFKKDGGNIAHGCFYIKPNHIQAIRNLFPPQLQHSSSTFELLCACMWRCRTLALQLPNNLDETVKFSMYVNLRGKDFMHLPPGYYGNAVVTPAVTAKVTDLVRENSWAYALQLVKESKEKVSEEYVRSMMDYMVVNGRRPTYSMDSLWMASNLTYAGFEVVDFGWGTPLYCGNPREDSMTSIISRVNNDRGEELRTVVMCLPMPAMVRLQKALEEIIGDPFKSFSIITQPTVESSKL